MWAVLGIGDEQAKHSKKRSAVVVALAGQGTWLLSLDVGVAIPAKNSEKSG